MYTQQWYLALALQGMISLTAFLCAVIALRVRWLEALVAVLMFNAMPLVPVPGFKTPLYIHDFLVPLAVLFVLTRQRDLPRGLLVLGLAAISLWPLLGIMNGVFRGVVGYLWVTFIYRRFAMAVFLLAGVCAAQRTNFRNFCDTYVLAWIGMASVGVLQYLGVLDVDFLWKNPYAFGGESVLRDATAQRGFLGLVRLSAGVVSGVMTAYCLANLLLQRRAGGLRIAMYTAAIALSAVVVLFSGSRGGLAGGLIGVAYVSMAALRRALHVRLTRLLIFGGVAVVGAFQLIAPAMDVIRRRLEGATQSHSFQSRLQTQRLVLDYTFSHADAAVVGMGLDSWTFQFCTGSTLTHAHSEYLQVLWSSGLPGLVLYLLLLYVLLRGMRPVPGNPPDVLGIATRGMFVVGLITGLSEANLLVVTPAQFTFGIFMLYMFGLRYGQVHHRVARWREWTRQHSATVLSARATVSLAGATGQ